MEKLMNDTIIKPGKAVAMCSDHAGFEMKSAIIDYLGSKGIAVENFGTNSADSCDYPDFAHPCAEAVESGRDYPGIAMCGTGNGIAMTLNKHQGIRAALCWKPEIAALAKQHNNANILVLPARFVTQREADIIVDAFLDATFEGGRHQRRIDKIPVAGCNC